MKKILLGVFIASIALTGQVKAQNSDYAYQKRKERAIKAFKKNTNAKYINRKGRLEDVINAIDQDNIELIKDDKWLVQYYFMRKYEKTCYKNLPKEVINWGANNLTNPYVRPTWNFADRDFRRRVQELCSEGRLNLSLD